MKRSVTEQRNRLAIIARAAREVLLAFGAYAPDEPMGPRVREGLAAKLHAAFQEADVSMADLDAGRE